RDASDLVDGGVEGGLVDLRRLREAADLADVLECGGADLVVGRGRIEVEEGADVAAHGGLPCSFCWEELASSREPTGRHRGGATAYATGAGASREVELP